MLPRRIAYNTLATRLSRFRSETSSSLILVSPSLLSYICSVGCGSLHSIYSYSIRERKNNVVKEMEFSAPGEQQPGWVDVADAADVVAGSRFRVSASTHPGWDGEPVAVFCLSDGGGLPQTRLFAISDACPHVAIGSLYDGDACAGLGDLEDIVGLRAAVLCPVHSYAFDLQTGHCVTDKGKGTPSAKVYRTRIITVSSPGAAKGSKNSDPSDGNSSAGSSDNQSRRVLQIHAVPEDAADNRVSLEAGNKAQLHLVQLALERKYGAPEKDADVDDLSDLLFGEI